MTFHSLAMLIILLISAWGEAPATAMSAVELRVSPEALASGVQRIGMNLGGWSSWGAEQLGSNILQNPGFEGVVDGALARVASVQGKRLSLGRNGSYSGDGFWNGAYLTFRTGRSAGKRVRVLTFEKNASSQEETLVTENEMQAAPGDVVALTRSVDGEAPTQWWIQANAANCPLGPARPGSPGQRSVTLCPVGTQSAELNSFLDTITARAGKLLPIEGKWRFSFWSAGVERNATLRVSFGREHAKPFFVQTNGQEKAWRKTTIEFNANDAGPDGVLQLQFVASRGAIRIDDVSLSREGDGDFPFRREVVETLKRMRPGYLRDWQGQLGDSLNNRLATPFARRASRYRSDSRNDAHYEYSIPDFLLLCQRVDSSPWIVLPTTFSDEEFQQLGEYLRVAQRRFRFREILVEFGNENWNPLFSTAGIQDPLRHQEAAARAFVHLRQGAGSSVPLRAVLNAQYANAAGFEALTRHAPADIMAVAPYFAYELPASTGADQADSILFASAEEQLRHLHSIAAANQKEMAVYEVNLHTVKGSANKAERDQFVLSQAAGAALAKRLIEAMLSGVRTQCVYSLSGYDSFIADGKGLVQLWGVARDLAGAPRLRSTGLAVELLNRSVQSEVHSLRAIREGSDSGLTAVAFRGPLGWSAAIVSSRSYETDVTLLFPAASDAKLPHAVAYLRGEKSNRADAGTNGTLPVLPTSAQVAAGLHSIRVQVPARGMAILLPSSSMKELPREVRP
jgi:hypothetical protein